tara:strand:+ start:1742 stop:2002 length:261 start_codon:yes stop_codon:yes gene_type:complete
MTRHHNINGVKVQFTEAEETQRDAEEAQVVIDREANQYKRDRAKEYPSWQDQMDMLWHSIDESPELKTKFFDFYEACKAVKVKYPK